MIESTALHNAPTTQRHSNFCNVTYEGVSDA